MFLKPINQEKLIGYNLLLNDFIKLVNEKKIPNKIMISGPKGIGKSTFAYHFINYIFSINEKNPYDIKKCEIQNENRSFKLVKNLTHPNFHLIDLLDEKKIIEISQIRKAIDYSQKSSFNNDFRIVLIDNVENLNLFSANALLKIVEEPNDKLIFILIHNNAKKIINTIKSRCIVFKKHFSFNENLSIANTLTNNNLKQFFNANVVNHYFTVGDYLNLFNFAKDNSLDLCEMSLKSLILHIINYKIYKNHPEIINLVFKLIVSFFHYSFQNEKSINMYNLYKDFIKKIDYTNKFNLDVESLFLEFKVKVL